MTLHDALEVLRYLTPPAGVGGEVHLEEVEGVAHLVLDHPAARSAVSFRMMVALAEHVIRLGTFDGHAVVVSSRDPRVFCAGGHLDELLSSLHTPERAAGMARAMAVVLDALRDLPAPTICAVHALAIGGGAEITTAADLRVFSSAARVQFVHTRLGVVPGWGGAPRLRRIVGPAVALRWLAVAEAVSAAECAAVGFADQVVDDDPRAAAVALAEAWRGRGAAVRAAKAQLAADAEGQAAAFAALWGGPVHREALSRAGRRA